MANKAELTRFLDRHVFEPILKADPSNYTGRERDKLADVQKRTRSEQERFHNYPSTEEFVRMYKDDLHSEKAKKVNAELQRLKLPLLADVKEEFLKLAGE